MTMRERILAVYRGQTPDVVPYMLDLSHWYLHKHSLPWDLSVSHEQPEVDLIDYHRRVGAGFYISLLGSFYGAQYGPDVQSDVYKEMHGETPELVWRLTTPLGQIERRRIWEPGSYSWAITRWGVKSEQDLRVLGYALASRTFTPQWDRYHVWRDAVGDQGVVYINVAYSAMGHLLNYWMGVSGTVYAASDWPHTLRTVVDEINENCLKLIDVVAASPAEVIIMGDNFSSDIQSPRFFKQWSRSYYVEAIRRLHAAGKVVAVHIDGRLRGALRMMAEAGADCADAVTPQPMGDLSALECRQEAGPDLILSGGVSPDLWLPQVSLDAFRRAVCEWLELRHLSPRLIANAGDQVPPYATEERIEMMHELVERYGRY